jgi:hypothetical protein
MRMKRSSKAACDGANCAQTGEGEASAAVQAKPAMTARRLGKGRH